MIKEIDRNYLRQIITLHKKTIFPLWDKIGKKYSIREVKEYVLDTLKKGKVFGYFEDMRLVGCAGVILDKKNKSGEVRHVIVDPKSQGKGIGKQLMAFIENYSKKNVKKLLLNVLIVNKAVNFYEKIGYKKYCYIMKKSIG